MGILLGGLVLLLCGCAGEKPKEEVIELVQEDEDIVYATSVVDYADVAYKVKLECTYTSTREEELSFPVSDKLIVQVNAKKGDYVSKGDLVAALDVEKLEEEISEQEYQLEHLELELKQMQELYDFDLNSAQVLYSYTAMSKEDEKQLKNKIKALDKQYKTGIEDLQDRLLLSRKRVQESRQEVQDGKLLATISGEITYLADSLQDTFSKEGTVVARISDPEACYFAVEGTDYASYFSEGASVTVDYQEAMKKKSVEAYPVHMEEWQDEMLLGVALDEMIPIGTRGNIELLVDEHTHVLCVPKSAIHQSDQGPFVYLSDEGFLQMRYVTLGLEGDGIVEIVNGLGQGDVVALKK